MTPTPAPAATLLVELAHRGIELQTHGDRLRYRPRSAMTPELAERIKVHKAELLALLRQGRPTKPPQKGQNRPAAVATSQTGMVGRLATVAGAYSSDAPHELSLAERVESGYVNPGWKPAAWADRLRQLADRCEAIRPELAAQYRTWAVNVLKNGKRLA